jgi:hypothetical protein
MSPLKIGSLEGETQVEDDICAHQDSFLLSIDTKDEVRQISLGVPRYFCM